MDLGKGDFVLDAVLQLPATDSPFECAADPIRHDRFAIRGVVFLLQPVQQGVGLQAGILCELLCDFVPKRFQGILPSAIVSGRRFVLTGDPTVVSIFANGPFAHL
jgi:hypothetical protein